MLRMAEIFRSIQGEGQYAGAPSVFVRTTGCNLRCWFCDTPYTSWTPEGEQRPWKDVLAEISHFSEEHVVLTGGEPLLQPDLAPLAAALRAEGRLVTIETAGTVYRDIPADLCSISPKLGNSTPSAERSAKWSRRHAQLREQPVIVQQLMQLGPYQLKFVVNQPEDLAEIHNFLAQIPDLCPDRVWLMPQGLTREAVRERGAWLEPLAVTHGWRYCPRLHIEQFGNVRGT